MTRRFTLFVAVLAIVLSTTTHSLAGEITDFSWTSGIASIAGIGIVPPVDPNNDDVDGASPNVIEILQKDYSGIGPIDIEFTVIPSGGTTEYAFTEGVQNSTGIDWTSYCMQLGFGVGDDFVPSPAGDGLDFDAPDYNSPFFFEPYGGAPFPTVVVNEDLVEASGGVQGGFDYAEPFLFTVDVPDGIESFTLRQLPKADPVPEPSAASIALVAVAALSAWRRA